MKRLIGVMAVLVLLFAGCGGGDDNNKADNASADTETDSGSGAQGGGDVGKLCAARAGFSAPDPSSAAAQAGGDMKSTMKAAKEALDQAEDWAPSEIKADVRIVVDAARPFYSLLAEVDYDFMKLASDPQRAQQLQALGDKFQEEKVEAAADRIEAWVQAHCN